MKGPFNLDLPEYQAGLAVCRCGRALSRSLFLSPAASHLMHVQGEAAHGSRCTALRAFMQMLPPPPPLPRGGGARYLTRLAVQVRC